MLFRVGLVSFLLIAALASEVGTPAEDPVSAYMWRLLGLIVATYGLTIAYALVLKRTREPLRIAGFQVGTDLILTSVLIYLTGGVESSFVFVYLLIIVAASLLFGRGALLTAGVSIFGYVLIAFLAASSLPTRQVIRLLAVNTVALAATGLLAARLAVELRRAGERIASQGLRLRELEAVHKDVIQCLTSGLVTVARDGRVMTFNAAAGEITGISPSLAVGRHVGDVLPALVPLNQALTDDGSLRRGEIRQTMPDGNERTLGVSLSPLVDSSGVAIGRIVNFQDLTELRRMEAVVVRTEHLAGVGRLAAAIAHEIRNPLAAISGSVELLAQTVNRDGAKEAHELMAIVMREVERLNALISDLLNFARPSSPQRVQLDLGQAIAEMVQVFSHDKRFSGAHIELQAGESVMIDVDPAQLRQVVWNLVLNAAEASPPHTSIVVAITRQEEAGGKTWARLEVRDRGPGIAAENRTRIFEPFFSTKQSGTGLGLATVHRIIEHHHGRVEIESEVGVGTTFSVMLPLL